MRNAVNNWSIYKSLSFSFLRKQIFFSYSEITFIQERYNDITDYIVMAVVNYKQFF